MITARNLSSLVLEIIDSETKKEEEDRIIMSKNRNMSAVYTTLKLFYVGILITLLSLSSFAQQPNPVILNNDNDIDNIIKQIGKYTKLAQQCSKSDCPNFDCKSAQKTFNNLRDARQYMRNTHFWLSRNAETSNDFFVSLANEGKLTGERLAKVQMILAYQEYVTNIASTMLDIANASVSLKDLSKNATKLSEMSGLELLGNLDTLYEGMKDFESANQAIKSGFTAETNSKSKIFGLGSDELDNFKSTLSDLKTMVREAIKTGKDWRKAFNTKNGRAAAGAIVGRIAKAYADSEINERKELIGNLTNDLKATNFAQSSAFNNLQRIRTRRNKAEDAFKALDKLLVIKSDGSSGTLTRCFLKKKNSCPLFDLNYVSKVDFDDKYETFNIRDENERRVRGSAEALLFFNKALQNKVPNLLRGSDLETTASVKPELRLTKTSFKPGENIKVKFAVSPCYGSGSWAGIIPSSVSHGSAKANFNENLSMDHLYQKTEGELNFKAPENPGSYDIRMNNSATGREVTSIAFTVLRKKPRSIPYIITQKRVFTTEEKIVFEYAVLLPKSRWIIGLAKDSSPLLKPIKFFRGRGYGTDSFNKLPPGKYEVRILQMHMETQVGPPKLGKIIYEKILAKDSFVVKNEETTLDPDVSSNIKRVKIFAKANSLGGGVAKDTGIDLIKGQSFTVRANPSQRWRAGEGLRVSNANGIKAFGKFTSHNLSALYGSLVGRIGNGKYFLVGTDFATTADTSGRLFLLYWDENNQDNSGSISVVISSQKRNPK